MVYRAVGKHQEPDLRAWLEDQDASDALTVFVGASSRHTESATSLVRAHEVWAQTRPDLRLGGVAIPERHTRRSDEHLRLIAKQEAGCSFFVTQVVYDVNAAKNLVSDYRYECNVRGLQWLGVDVPRWIQNDLRPRGRHIAGVVRPRPGGGA